MTFRKAVGIFLIVIGFGAVGIGDAMFWRADTGVELAKGVILIVAGVITFHRGIFKVKA